MPTVLEGRFDGRGRKIAIAAARFNSPIVEQLEAGAIDALTRHGVAAADITIARVPGAWELPVVVRKLATSGKYGAVIALGAVIRGETPHFDYVAGESAKGLAAAGGAVPVVFGVLTTDTVDQAWARAGLKGGNKGAESALVALEMISLLEQI
jgi:6,7-dimethyl-8-ribityllumazine synthase